MNQNNKTARLQSWIANNYKDWNTICGLGQHPISEQEFMRIFDVLSDNCFEEIKWVLITCHYYAVQERVSRNIRAIVKDRIKERKQRGENSEDFPKQ